MAAGMEGEWMNELTFLLAIELVTLTVYYLLTHVLVIELADIRTYMPS